MLYRQKMIIDAYKDSHDNDDNREICPVQRESGFTNKILISQGVASSIDALSVGFAFSGMTFLQVANASVSIAIVTFIMGFCFAKVLIFIGDKINAKAELIGGVALIASGIKMLL